MFEQLSQSLPEVISTKWLVLACLLLLGVKLGAKGLGWLRQASTGMLVASLLFFSGLGGAGWSIGDVASNWSTPAVDQQESIEGTLSNQELLALAKDSPNIDADTLRQILSYAAVRDSQAVVVVNQQGEVVKVHAMPNKLLSQPNEQIQYVTHQEGDKKVKVAPASLTEDKQETVTAAAPALPLQWSLALVGGCLALTVIGVVLAGRTANKLRNTQSA